MGLSAIMGGVGGTADAPHYGAIAGYFVEPTWGLEPQTCCLQNSCQSNRVVLLWGRRKGILDAILCAVSAEKQVDGVPE